jgi:hypothetical protein
MGNLAVYVCEVRGKPNKCRGCGSSKPCGDFRKDRSRLHGHVKECLACSRKRFGSVCECGAKKYRYAERCRPCHDQYFAGANHPSWTGGRAFCATGYVRINAGPGLTVFEHRHVLEQHLGRPLTVEENVHHKNGDRADNRLENLEVWNKSQPSGQRPIDKVRHALDILRLYAPSSLSPEVAENPDLLFLDPKIRQIAGLGR